MKKVLMMLICLALMMNTALAEMNVVPGSPAEDYPAVPGELLGFELLEKLYASGENRVLSPQSLALALGMAAEGAQGNTLAEILSALGVQDVSEITAALPEGLKSANAVFTLPGLVLREDYVNRLNESYAAQWFEIDAGVVDKVNAWVQEHTEGMIGEMLSQAPDAGIGMILLNAVAMDADWTSPFMPEGTTEDSFHAPDGIVTVPMMHQTARFDYAEKDGVQIVRLPYTNGLEMWIAMPEWSGMEALLDILANEGMFYLKSDAEMREVILSMPKVDIADENTLNDALKALGIEAAFGGEADFSGISEMPMCIDDVLQKTRLQIDEDGTKAAAATMMTMRVMSARPDREPVEMNINRPFVFAVTDAGTGRVCFSGVIENPAAE